MKKLVLKDSFHDDFLKNLTKSIEIHSKFSYKLGLTKIQPGLVLNLFLISDKNPG